MCPFGQGKWCRGAWGGKVGNWALGTWVGAQAGGGGGELDTAVVMASGVPDRVVRVQHALFNSPMRM